jgi:hypothetical protein
MEIVHIALLKRTGSGNRAILTPSAAPRRGQRVEIATLSKFLNSA